ncbi:MAG: hypothetical protein CL947_01050 [Epsilonproteobacteria bacterium]|nr:hypothetical protein [Campylobacterota bacterium]|tara:strand:- start:1893 stop:2804 length:912 start_codon:yes stop_codon:yes gene_type:complete
MVQSMTGYASSIIEIPIKEQERLSLSISIKSLNSRYFEATCKVPYLLANIDVSIQRILKQKLHRGHVYITVKIQHDTLKHSVVPSLSTVKGYLKAIKTIKDECKINDAVSLQSILQLPNILQVAEEALTQKTEKAILKEIEGIADQLIKTRKTEGKILVGDITTQIKIIAKKLTEIEKASLKAAVEKKQELNTVISKLQTFSPEELCTNKCLLENQKTVLLSELEKIDINEEIVRANSHITTILEWLKSESDTKGKKLDFILQELNRETNTIASKCSSFTISSRSIDIKAALEKCREQAQNIV